MEGGTQLGSGGRAAWGAGLVGCTCAGDGVCVVVLSGAECVRAAGWSTGLGGHGCDAVASVLEINTNNVIPLVRHMYVGIPSINDFEKLNTFLGSYLGYILFYDGLHDF